MRVSDAVRVNHEYRHWQKAKTTRERISSRLQWYLKNCPDRVLPLHLERVEEISASLGREIAADTLAWEINVYLSRRPTLTIPTSEILNWVFENLPPPKQAKLSHMEQAITTLLKEQYYEAQKQQHYFHLMCEMALRAKQGWYCILSTLTVDDAHYGKVFSKNADYFRDYIRRTDRQFAIAAHGSIRNSKGKLYHLYFAATEQGGKNGRLHIHCLHICKQLPKGTTDPNYGKKQPDQWLLVNLRRYWTAGGSDPRICRHSPQDAYGKIGWRWPLDEKSREPYAIKSPLALAKYVSKYIQKGYTSWQRKKSMWRVKKSHQLGMALINLITEPLSTSTLLILANTETIRAKLNGELIPATTLRLSSLRQLQNRNLQDIPNLSHMTFLELAKKSHTRLSPLHYSRASTQTILENNQQSISSLLTAGLANTASYNAAAEDLRNSVWEIQQQYFPPGVRSYGCGSSRADIIVPAGNNENKTNGTKPRNKSTNKNTRSTRNNNNEV